jgi:hypothetical protein
MPFWRERIAAAACFAFEGVNWMGGRLTVRQPGLFPWKSEDAR